MILQSEPLTEISQLGEFSLRELDEKECWAIGLSSEETIRQAIATSDASFSVWAGNDLLCVWGFKPGTILDPGVYVWLLTTGQVLLHKKEFLREGRRLLSALLQLYPEVKCFVWQGHGQALNWLTRWGFSAYGSKIDMYAEFNIMRKAA